MNDKISHKLPDNHKVHMLRTDLANMVEALPLMIEYERVRADITRAKYLELVRAGFTKEEALQLCK